MSGIIRIQCLGLPAPVDQSCVDAAFHVNAKMKGEELLSWIPLCDEFERVRLVDPRNISTLLEKEGGRITPDCRGNIDLLLKQTDAK